MTSGIYKITNTITGKIYVGSSKNMKNRLYTHFADLKAGIHHNSYMQHSYNKHGRDAFVETVLEKVDEVHLREREQYWLDLTRCYDANIGYNADKTSCYNPIRTAPEGERRERWINSIKERQRNNKGRLGIPHDDATKKLIGDANAGESHAYAKMNNTSVREVKWIRERLGVHYGLINALASHYNVSIGIISDIIHNRTWVRVELGSEIPITEFERTYECTLSLTRQQAHTAMQLLMSGNTATEAARTLEVPSLHVHSIAQGQSWTRDYIPGFREWLDNKK